MKKRLLICSTDVMMIQFLVPHAVYLTEKGYTVDVVCSHAEGYKKEGYHEQIREMLPEGSEFFPVSLERNPYSPKNLTGLKELKRIIGVKKYDIIWANEPVMGVMTRLAARKTRKAGTKVLYMAHGYHFFEGAPRKNWIYYPIEKVMAHFCDAMCMINYEDFEFTKKHMPGKPVYHIDGVGLDTHKFETVTVDRRAKRAELGVGEDDILVLSVGELQTRKNHEPVVRAIAAMKNPHIKYIICGRGELYDHLLRVAKETGLGENLTLTGHRYDIGEILKSSDIFVHPSQREGLGIAPLEAMAAGLPLVTSDVQGIKDYVINDETGYVLKPMDVEGYRKAIEKLIQNPDLREKIGKHNMEAVRKYDIANSRVQIHEMIEDILKH